MRRFLALTAVLTVLALAPQARTATPPTFHAPVALPGSEHGTEPSLAVSEKGVRFASWQGPGHVATSKDGVSFADLGEIDSTAVGDVTNAIDADGAFYNGQVCGDAFALHACVYRSTDGGKTWPQKTEPADTHPGAADRPWIDVYPHRSTSPGARQPTTVYLEYHTFSPEVLTYATVSHDAGKTFSTPKLLSTDTNAIEDSSCNTIPGGIVADDRDGTAYAVWITGNDVVANGVTGCNYTQISPYNKAWVSTSTDGGATWTSHLAWEGAWDQTTLVGDNAGHLFPSITVDRDGQVHLLLPVRRHDDPMHLFTSCQTTGCDEVPAKTDLLFLTSPDKGAHWTTPISFNPGGGSNFFPWLAGGTGGVVDGIYYQSATTKPNDASSLWYIGFTQITGATAVVTGEEAAYASAPVLTSRLLSPAPVHQGGICTYGTFCAAVRGSNRSLADSIAIALDPSGGANMVWTNDYPDPAHKKIEFTCQSGGASAFAGAPDLGACFGQVVVLGTKTSATPGAGPTTAPKPSTGKAGQTKGGTKGSTKHGSGTLPATGVAGAPAWAWALPGAALVLGVWSRRRARA